ncbi:MAG TPA: amidohydrolase family protein [Candidatus Acidoferrales bacterium]|nr:amidohydrolase family protein [Candidatus Acidoferrales bacterium]
MKAEDLILVSVDDHVVEPPTVFDHQLPVQWKSKAPRVVHKKDGSDVWVFNGEQFPNVALNAVVGRPPEEYGMEPTSFSQLRPGTWNVHERVRDMNVNGVLASLCFPSFPGLFGDKLAKVADKELALTMLRAYNDWHIDEWCGAYPGRFIPLGLLPSWAPKLMADEVRRLAKKGCKAVSFTESPESHGWASLHSEYWDPFWTACADEGTVICIHIGSGSGMKFSAMDAPVDTMITIQPIACVDCAANLLWSRVLKQFPTLRIAMSEGGIGWIPYFLERADYVHGRHHVWTHQDFGGKKPSDVWREHMIACFIDDPVGIRNREAIGIDTITWECDYPHSDTTWPKSPEALARCFGGVPDDHINKITHENALRFFGFDAFKYRPKERCTVRALRAESPDVDLSVKSQGGKPPTNERRPVTTADILQQLSTVYSTVPEDA